MPTPKYYCDYCDKQFHDTPASRKRHLQGIMHQRAKKAWFDSCGEQEDSSRGVCAYFLKTGTCQYGQSCKYIHPAQPASPYPGNSISGMNMYEPPMGPPLTDITGMMQGTSHVTRSQGESKLPPSLQPPPEGGYPSLPFVDWG